MRTLTLQQRCADLRAGAVADRCCQLSSGACVHAVGACSMLGFEKRLAVILRPDKAPQETS
jgi:hypothetical protein